MGNAKRVWTVCLDVALACVLAAVLLLAGVVVRSQWLDEGVSAALDPFAETVRARLTVGADAPEARFALDVIRASGATEEQLVAALLDDEDGATWLVVRARGEHDPAVAVRAAREAGCFDGGVRIEHTVLDLALVDEAGPDAPLRSLGWLLPWMLCVSGASFLIGGLVARRRRPGELGAAVGGFGARVGAGLLVGVAALVVTAGITVLMTALGVPPVEQEWVTRLADGGPASFAVLILAAGVLAPLGEEVLFRGHVFRWLRVNDARGAAYAVSAALFALAHLNPSALPHYVAYALLFAWAYERWRSLVVPIVAHAVVNLTALGLLRAGIL